MIGLRLFSLKNSSHAIFAPGYLKEKYSKLIKEIEEKIYFLLDNFSKPSDNDKKNTIFFDVGYNSDQQLDLGINYNRTINNIVIGGGFHVETNFKDDTNFIFNFNFGWRF